MKYTVILLYPDYSTNDFGGDTYIDSIEAKTPKDAARMIQGLAADVNGGDIPPEDFRVIAVFQGDPILELDASNF